MPRRIVSIVLISLVLLGLLVPISVSFVQAKNEKLVHIIIDTVGTPKNEHADAVKELGGKVRYKYKLIDAIAVSLPESIIDKILDKLVDKPWVKRISLDKEVHALLDVSVPTIKAPSIWNEYDGSGIKIAICDTGIDKYHSDLKGKVVAENMYLSSIWGMFEGPEDNNGHGTHVAGIAAGTGSASGGKYKGVAPGALLINAKCLDMTGSGYLSDVIAAIQWSVEKGADVISLSIGAPGPCGGTCDLCMAVNKAVDAGVVVVVAAGNSGPDPKTITCPGNAEKAITVGAADDHGTTVTDDDTITEWSSRGPTSDGRKKPDVVAPGVNIMSCNYNTNGYIAMSGTSMATPHVSGAVALLLSARPSLTPAEVKDALKNSAINLGYDENTQGAGEIDVFAAYQFIMGGLSVQADAQPAQVDKGDKFDVHAKITNNAGVTAAGVKATINLPEGLSLPSGESNEKVLQSNLGPGASGEVSWQVQADTPGSYSITVSAIDSTMALTGKGTASVKVLTPPSIGITELISPSMVYEGDIFTVKATIKNNGESTASGVTATISLDPTLLPEEPVKTVGDLIGGSSQTVTWNVKATQIGTKTITVQVGSSNGGIYSMSTTIDVQEKSANPTAYVRIDMSMKSLWKLLWRVTATVTITSDSNINGATVVGHWSDAYLGTVSGTINNGKVSFRTPWIYTVGQGSVSFTIDKVVKDGQEYALTGDKTKSIVGP